MMTKPAVAADPLLSYDRFAAPVDYDGGFLVAEPQPRHMIADIRSQARSQADDGQYQHWGGDLPPKRFWRVNPYEQGYETPTDAHGLVDVKKLVGLCRDSVAPGYIWPTNWTRKDHLYWSEQAYEQLARRLGSSLPITFRNLPPNIVRLPLALERWKHHLTMPSDFPSRDVMHNSVQAWSTAESLFNSIAEAVQLERRRRNRRLGLSAGKLALVPKDPEDTYAETYFVEALASTHAGVARDLARHQRVPDAFRIISDDATAADVRRQLSYMVKYRCRDGIRSRQLCFEPHTSDTPAGEAIYGACAA